MPFHQYYANIFLLIYTDNNIGKQIWNEKSIGCDLTLAFIFLLNVGSSSIDQSHFSPERFSSMQSSINRARDFISWIIWGQDGGSSTFLSRSIDLAFILFKHDQYCAAEVIYLPLLFLPEWDFGPFTLFLYSSYLY
jgi:nuclear pore complex protein Nup160